MILKFIQNFSTTRLIFILSILSTFLVVGDYFAYTGYALTFVIFATLFLWKRPKITTKIIVLYALTLILALFLILRANTLLTFFNFLSLCYCLALISYPAKKSSKYSFFNLLFLPVVQLVAVISIKTEHTFKGVFKSQKLEPKTEAETSKTLEVDDQKTASSSELKPETQPKTTPAIKQPIEWNKIFLGVAASIVVLSVIIPVLVSSNPFFGQYLESFFDVFSILDQLFSYIFNPLIIWRILCFIIFWFYLSRSVTALEKTDYALGKSEIMPVSDNLAWFIPKLSVMTVLVLFFVSQVQFYLSPPEVLIEMGYSYSRYVNEIFGQMSFVALVVFSLVFFDKFYKGKALVASLILILEGLFLLAIGLKSDLDYIFAAGLTFKRLYGLAIILWLGSVYVGFGYSIWKKKSHAWYLRAITAVTLLIVIGVNFANFDTLIYRVNPARETTGVDISYFREISSDAGADDEIYFQLSKLDSQDLTRQPHQGVAPGEIASPNGYQEIPYQRVGISQVYPVAARIKYLQKKYRTFQFQSFNWSEYLSYQKVKNIDLNQTDQETNL